MKCRVRKVLRGDEESQTQVRLCMAGGSQDKQLQSLQQLSRSRLPGQTPTEAERGCSSTPLQLGRAVYVLRLPLCLLATRHLHLSLELAAKETKTPVGFLHFCPETEHRTSDTGPPSFRNEGSESRESGAFPSVLCCLLPAFLLAGEMM